MTHRIQKWKGTFHPKVQEYTECVTLCDWQREPNQQGRLTEALTDREFVNVYSQDGKILSSFWKCTLREVLALVRNKQRNASTPVLIKDSNGYELCIQGGKK